MAAVYNNESPQLTSSRKRKSNKGIATQQKVDKRKKRDHISLTKANARELELELTSHPLFNNEGDIYFMLRQYPTPKNGNIHANTVVGDAIVLHTSKIAQLIEHLEYLKNVNNYDCEIKANPNMNSTPVNVLPIIHAETQLEYVDELDLNAPQSIHSREMINIFIKLMMEDFRKVLRGNCFGCKIDDPSQVNHQLCTMADADVQVLVCFNELLANVDEMLANELCFE